MDWWIDLFIHGVLALVAGMALNRVVVLERSVRSLRRVLAQRTNMMLDLIELSLNARITEEERKRL